MELFSKVPQKYKARRIALFIIKEIYIGQIKSKKITWVKLLIFTNNFSQDYILMYSDITLVSIIVGPTKLSFTDLIVFSKISKNYHNSFVSSNIFSINWISCENSSLWVTGLQSMSLYRDKHSNLTFFYFSSSFLKSWKAW